MADRVMKLKKGDTVKVVSGRERGKQAKILHTLPREGKIVLEGLFLVKKIARAKKSGEKNQMVSAPRAISASKVMLMCKHCGSATRIGYRGTGSEKARICKKCGATI